MVGCQRTGEAIVIDPSRSIEQYLDAAAAEGLRITGSAETHIHADFVSGSRELPQHLPTKTSGVSQKQSRTLGLSGTDLGSGRIRGLSGTDLGSGR